MGDDSCSDVTLTSTWAKVSCAPWWATSGSMPTDHTCTPSPRSVLDATEALEATHALRRRSYLVMIFSSLSRLAVMDASTELFPLIHAPPSRNRDWRISSVTVPWSNTSVTMVAS